MKIILSGYNIDIDELNKLKQSSDAEVTLTPETFSSAYARISRSPQHVDELRKLACAEVDKSRAVNKRIVFEMGHSSVAEHAVFNFDIIGISRFAAEALEKFRLCSYTEKSQRYITLEDDYVIPSEINQNEKAKDIFKKTIFKQNQFYWKLFDKLKKYVFEKHKDLAEDTKKHRLLEGWAKEDARYITSLATECQLGMTLNCRNFELMLRRFASSDYKEINELGVNLYNQAKDIAPSIIRYHEKNNYDSKTYKCLKGFFDEKLLGKSVFERGSEVQLLSITDDLDNKILAALLHKVSSLSYNDCLNKISQMTPIAKEEFIKKSFEHMNLYDSVLREFEYGSFMFDLVVSASCFAQLKRHRMSSMTMQDYDPDLGITMPQSIIDINMDKEFQQIIDMTNNSYNEIKTKCGTSAQYILTNAHRRRVLMKMNVRELYHISRLREDEHAQWDIKELAVSMVNLVKQKAPLTLMLIGGKDKFAKIFESVCCK